MRLAVVGEAPGKQECVQGRPFVGESGRVLRSILSQVGVNPDTVFYTNTVLCQQPPEGAPTDEMISGCAPGLLEELEEFAPHRILSLGVSALKALTSGRESRIMDARSHWEFNERLRCWVLYTYHPAHILRNDFLFRDLAYDIEKCVRTEPIDWQDPCVRVPTTLTQALAQIDALSRSGVRTIAYDIETSSLDPKDGYVLCLGLYAGKNNVLVLDRAALGSVQVQEALQRLFDRKDITFVAHNGAAFDSFYLFHSLGIRARVDFDTLLGNYTIDERGGVQGLKYLTGVHFNAPDYEKELTPYLAKGKDLTYASIPEPILHKYLGQDVIGTQRLYEHIYPKVQDEGTIDLERFLSRAARCLVEVQQNGARLDLPYLRQLGTDWGKEFGEITARLQQESGMPAFNVNSPKQVGVLLYDVLKLPNIVGGGYRRASKRDAGGKERSTEAGTLMTLSEYDTTGMVNLIREARQLTKLKSTYVDGLLNRVDPDERIRTDYILHGTDTGRMSSRNPNLQNLPKLFGPQIRNAFVATPGWTLVECDYSQLELRIAAWYSRDDVLIDALAPGKDIHRETASNMYQKPPQDITVEERTLAKYIPFGILYGRQAAAIAEQVKVSRHPRPSHEEAMAEAERIVANFKTRFWKLMQWREQTIKDMFATGYVGTPMGRKRRFPFVTDRTATDIQNQCINSPIQSLASDVCLMSLCRIQDSLIGRAPRIDGLDPHNVRILLTVHDSILFEVREGYMDGAIPAIKKVMTDPPLEYRVPFLVDAAVGVRWGDMAK